jgi:hypothetical protein
MADDKNWDANRKVDAPEAVNDGQADEDAQAQTVADEALAAHRNRQGQPHKDTVDASGSDKAGSGDEDDDVQDLVDHIDQMESSGRIDNDAFRGERNDDDEEGGLGRGGVERDAPRGAE